MMKTPSRSNSITPDVIPPGAQPPVIPTSTDNLVISPRISTLRRRGTELLSDSPFSSPNPFDADDFEFPSLVSSTRTLRGNPVASGRGTLARSTHGLSLLSTDSQRSSEITSINSGGVESAAFFSPDPWDTNEVDLDQMENVLVSPNTTIRGNPFRTIHYPAQHLVPSSLESIQDNNQESRHGTTDQFLTLNEGFDEKEMTKQLDSMTLPPDTIMRSSPFALRQNMPGRSMHSSLLTSMPDTPNEPALGTLGGMTTSVEESGKENKSMWDPDDDEFDNWPGQDTLNNLAMKFTLKRDNRKSKHSASSETDSTDHKIIENINDKVKSDIPICGANLTAREHHELMDELADRSCGNPYGPDAHDKVMQQFFSNRCKALPASRPARQMHVVDRDAYLNSTDSVVQSTFPRLCDAVATVLYLTNPNCLHDFLDANVKVFEWRRDGNCLLIRRHGNEVIVGTFLNLATLYLWGFYVRCTISHDGQWTETYAAVTQGTTPVTKEGVQFDRFVAEPGRDDISSSDPRWALYMGREMAYFMLNREVWDFRTWFRWRLEWETDGVVSNAKERERDLYRRSRTMDEEES